MSVTLNNVPTNSNSGLGKHSRVIKAKVKVIDYVKASLPILLRMFKGLEKA